MTAQQAEPQAIPLDPLTIGVVVVTLRWDEEAGHAVTESTVSLAPDYPYATAPVLERLTTALAATATAIREQDLPAHRAADEEAGR